MSVNIIPARELNLTYIVLDTIFLVLFVCILILKKKKSALIMFLIGGVTYFIVDYVFFYHVSMSRTVLINGVNANEATYFFYLLWHEISSGGTNIALIWLLIDKDEDAPLITFMTVLWWFILPAISELGGERNIATMRTTNAYHGPMAIILIVSYLIVIIYNLFSKKEKRVNVFFLFALGFLIQFAWESAFLLYGIRTVDENSFSTLIIDSLIETNLGMPFIYLLNRVYRYKYPKREKEVFSVNN